MSNSISDLVSVTKAASLLSMHPQTIYRKIYRGEIPVVKIGKSIRIKLIDLGVTPSSNMTFEPNDKPVPPFLEALFWDVPFQTLKPNSQIVLERVLEYGDLSAIHWLLETVSQNDIKAFMNKLGRKRLSPKSLNFYRLIFGIVDEGKDIKSKAEKSLGKTHWS